MFERGEDFELRDHKSGGTSFKPPFEYVDDNGITPVGLIYLTDLYGDFPDHPPGYPVMWWINSTCTDTPPFGHVVHL